MAEREKRRATTFRTSKGTIVNVAAPTVYVSPAFLSTEDVTNPTEMGEVLRKELDVHSAFTWGKFLRGGVDAHFDCWYRKEDGTWYDGKGSDYWVQTLYDIGIGYPIGTLTCPSGIGTVSLRSKNSFPYGILTLRTKFPALTDVNVSQSVFAGFEVGDNVGAGVANFYFERRGGADSLHLLASTAFLWYDHDVTALLVHYFPNYKNDYVPYTVAMRRNVVEWYVGRYLIGVAVNPGRYAFSPIAGPPYAILSYPTRFNPNGLAILDLDRMSAGPKVAPLTVEIAHYNYRVISGDELSPAVYQLYETGTWNTLAGMVIAAGSKTSHPVPTLGYTGKTIFFQANQAGTLVIEVLMETGNWRTYASPAVVANTLLVYPLGGDAVLSRVNFTPSAFPCTVNEAEVVLQ